MRTKLLTILMIILWSLPLMAQEVDTAWVRRYNGPGNDRDEALAIRVDGSGNVYATGFIYGSGTDYDYATIKYYPDGDTAWVRTYNGPADSTDAATAMALDGSGNVYVTGSSIGVGTSHDYATVKYFPNGDTAWVRRYNGPGTGYDVAWAVTFDGSGNVLVTGHTDGGSTGDDFTTIKYCSNGDTAWVRTYNGPGDSRDVGRKVVVDASDNVYVTGESQGETSCDYATIKYYPNGDTAWVRRYNGSGDGTDNPIDMALDDCGNVYVTGHIQGSGTRSDYATVKYYPNGDTAWVRTYNGPTDSSDVARAIAVDGAGNVYVSGSSRGSGTSYDWATIEYDANGDTAWVRRYDGPSSRADEAYDLAVDASGNVYVTGSSSITGAGRDYVTIRYNPNGDAAWVARYSGPGNSHDDAVAIAADDSGNVYVSGGSRGSGGDDDWATIKYCQCESTPFSLLFPPNKAFTPRKVGFDWQNPSDPVSSNEVTYELHLSTSGNFSPDSTEVDSGLTRSEHIKALNYGKYYWKVRAHAGCGASTWSDEVRSLMVTGVFCSLGDFNKDGAIDVGDVVFAVNYLYRSGPTPEPLELGDVNCDDALDVGDVVFLINFLFKSGASPSC